MKSIVYRNYGGKQDNELNTDKTSMTQMLCVHSCHMYNFKIWFHHTIFGSVNFLNNTYIPLQLLILNAFMIMWYIIYWTSSNYMMQF